jgi:hypothetical protein
MKVYQIWGYINKGHWYGYQPIKTFMDIDDVIDYIRENPIDRSNTKICDEVMFGKQVLCEPGHELPIIFTQEAILI